MKKLDWYILKKYYSTFFFMIVLLLLLVIVIDFSEKSDDFVKAKLSGSYVINNYYLGFVPHIVALLFHLFVFIAVIFFTSKMASRNEVIAILSSGVTYKRFLRPYFIGSFLLAALLWWANGYVVPHANRIRGDFMSKYIDKNTDPNAYARNFRDVYLQTDSFTYAGIKSYDTTTKSANRFFLHTIRNGNLVTNLRSNSFRWDTAVKNSWRLENVLERNVKTLGEADQFIAYKNVRYNFGPEDIRFDDYVKDKLSTPALRKRIILEEKRGSEGINRLRVELYRRDASAFAVIVLGMIGVLIGSRKIRGGMGLHLAFGLLGAVMYVLFDKFSSVFATNASFNPILAAWLPNIVFVGVTLLLYRKAQK